MGKLMCVVDEISRFMTFQLKLIEAGKQREVSRSTMSLLEKVNGELVSLNSGVKMEGRKEESGGCQMIELC